VTASALPRSWSARERRLAFLLLLAGAVLRLLQYLSNRSLWLDEAALARNILDRSAWRLVSTPLDYVQTAPPGFLLAEKLVTTLAGGSEYALRFIPLVLGLISLPLFLAVARRLLPPPATLVALAMFAFSGRLIYYASEVKQYGPDVTVALLLVWLVLIARERGFSPRLTAGLALAGAVAPWLSQPALFVLAAAGLLDGRPATTHWKLAPAFAKQYPKVKLQPEVLYVEDGNVLTSAGTAAGIDCCLHLLRRWCGAEVANRVARRVVLAPHRRGGQAQFIEQPLPPPGADARVQNLLNWLLAHIDQRHELDALARRVAMSRRTFTRQFQKATGTSVLQWLTHQRLTLAGRLLETTDRPVESIASDAGFGSALSLRQHFAARYGVTPAAYRRQYRVSA